MSPTILFGDRVTTFRTAESDRAAVIRRISKIWLSLGLTDRKVRGKKGLDAAFNRMEDYLKVSHLRQLPQRAVGDAGFRKEDRRFAFYILFSSLISAAISKRDTTSSVVE